VGSSRKLTDDDHADDDEAHETSLYREVEESWFISTCGEHLQVSLLDCGMRDAQTTLSLYMKKPDTPASLDRLP
jgi:hypothetical protein